MSRKEDKQHQLIKLLENKPLLSAVELASELNIGLSTVHRYLVELDITLNKRSSEPHKLVLERLYTSGIPLGVIMKELNLSKAMFFFYKNKYNIPNRSSVAHDSVNTLQDISIQLQVCYGQLMNTRKLRCHVVQDANDVIINTLVNTKRCIDFRSEVRTMLGAVERVASVTHDEELVALISEIPFRYTKVVSYGNSTFTTQGDAHKVIARAIFVDEYDEGMFMPISTILNTARRLLHKRLGIINEFKNLI